MNVLGREAIACVGAMALGVACGGGKPAPTGPTATATTSDAGVTALSKSALASAPPDALRESAFDALDAGELATAEEPLLELMRRTPNAAGGARALLDELRTVTGRLTLRAHPFDNVEPIVAAVPVRATAIAPRKVSGKLKLEVLADAGAHTDMNDVQQAMQLWTNARVEEHLHASSRGTQSEHPFLPQWLGGYELSSWRWSDGRWIATYTIRGLSRFIALLDPKTGASSVIDLEPWGDGVAGVGLHTAVLGGNVLYVLHESAGRGRVDTSLYEIVALDIKTGKIIWQSPAFASASLLVMGEKELFISGWQPSSVIVLSRETGAFVDTVATPDSSAIVAHEGFVEVMTMNRDGRTKHMALRANVHDVGEPVAYETKAATRIASARALSALVKAARREVFAALEAGNVELAFQKARVLLHDAPGNLAVVALYEAARIELETGYDRAADTVLKASPPEIATLKAAKNKPAPVERSRPKPPRVRFAEARVAPQKSTDVLCKELDVVPLSYEDDRAPTRFALPPRPRWLLESESNATTCLHGTRVTAHVGRREGNFLAVFEEQKPLAIFETPREVYMATSCNFGGSVIYVMFHDREAKSWMSALDLKTGAPYWSTALGESRYPMTISWLGGYVVALDMTGQSLGALVVEGDTGKIVERIAGPATVYGATVAGGKDGSIWVVSAGRAEHLVFD